MRARRERHWTFMHGGIPEAYESARSEIKVDKEAVAAGGKLYAENCASCHGKTGDGDGEAGKSLTPSPALLSFLIERPISVDPYLLWTISEGGKQFGTDMPAFKDKLSRDEIWKVVAYMRAGFPKVVEEAK
jgi:mono/diheme cytochrome c family protein